MKSPKNSLVDNFSLKTLRHLAQYGLQSSTAGIFRREGKKHILSDCICFPWLVVEHKRDAKGENQCYCQAANAGVAAVMMLETLSHIVPDEILGKQREEAQPVVTITTVDKTVRVWIAYACDNFIHSDGPKFVSTWFPICIPAPRYIPTLDC